MLTPSWAEISFFLTLAVISFSLFWQRLGPVVRTVLASKPDAGFARGKLVQRIREFAWEVLLQGKVIRERPLPGIAHALVFWGSSP